MEKPETSFLTCLILSKTGKNQDQETTLNRPVRSLGEKSRILYNHTV